MPACSPKTSWKVLDRLAQEAGVDVYTKARKSKTAVCEELAKKTTKGSPRGTRKLAKPHVARRKAFHCPIDGIYVGSERYPHALCSAHKHEIVSSRGKPCKISGSEYTRMFCCGKMCTPTAFVRGVEVSVETAHISGGDVLQPV